MLDSDKSFIYATSFIFNKALPQIISVIAGIQKAVCRYEGKENLLLKENYERAIKPLFVIQFKLLELSKELGPVLNLSLVDKTMGVDEEAVQKAFDGLIVKLYPHIPIDFNKEEIAALFKQTMSFFDLVFGEISYCAERALAQNSPIFEDKAKAMKWVCALSKLYKGAEVERDLFARIDNVVADVCYDLIYTRKRRLVVPEALVNLGGMLTSSLGYFLYHNDSVRILDLSGCKLTSASIEKLKPAIVNSKNSLNDLRLAQCGLDDQSFEQIVCLISKRNKKEKSTKIETLVVSGNNLTLSAAEFLCKSSLRKSMKTITITFGLGFREACELLYNFTKTSVIERINLPQPHLLSKTEAQMQLALEYRREQSSTR